METAKQDSNTSESVHCTACNTFVDCNAYNFHILGKKHKKNASKTKQQFQKPKESLVCQPQFIFEELAPLELQFKSFLNQVLLSREECNSTTLRILHDIGPCLSREFGTCCPYIFGSMASGLALIGSDVDIFLDTGIYDRRLNSPNPKEDLKRVVTRCARALRTDRKFSHIIPIGMARVPIVKFMHLPSGVSCDISFKDSLGVANTKLLQFYLSLNPRFFEVMVAIKFWAKESEFCKCDAISSYGWTLLFISFLQTLKWPNGERMVTSVYDLQRGVQPAPWWLINGWRVDFHPKHSFVLLPAEPQFSHFGLLKGFFKYYQNFDFEENIVCPYLGHPIPWSSAMSDDADMPPEFRWCHDQMKAHQSSKGSPRQHVSIQDPFQHDFLLGGSCSIKKFERILKGFHAATEICETEELLVDPNSSKFLTSLFSAQPYEREDRVKFKLRDIPGLKKEVIRERLFVMLENTFTKIMKFELKVQSGVCVRSTGQPDSKVAKKIETQDVHQLNDGIPMEKKYNCSAFHPVWCFRKKSRKDVNLAYPETAFEFEAKLSDVIVKQNYPSQRIEFSCGVRLSDSLVFVMVLEQTNKQHSKSSNDLFEFLKNNLPRWINIFLGEAFQGSAVSAHVPSEPSTSIDDGKVGAEVDDSENGDIIRSCSETACEDSNSSLEAMDQKQTGDNAELDNS